MRNRLVPMPLPWMISPSVSGLKLELAENSNICVQVNVAFDPNGPTHSDANPRVQLTFDAGQWLRTYPASSDTESLPLGRFDMSLIPFTNESTSAELLSEFFYKDWSRTGICPTSGLYEVASSSWLHDEEAEQFGFKHFVLAARDMWLETLAAGFSWVLLPDE